MLLAVPGQGLQIVPLTNTAVAPERGFEVPAAELLALERHLVRSGAQVRALFHSHPGAPPTPSRADLAFAAPGGLPRWPGLLLLITSLQPGRPPVHRLWTCEGAPASLQLIENAGICKMGAS